MAYKGDLPSGSGELKRQIESLRYEIRMFNELLETEENLDVRFMIRDSIKDNYLKVKQLITENIQHRERHASPKKQEFHQQYVILIERQWMSLYEEWRAAAKRTRFKVEHDFPLAELYEDMEKVKRRESELEDAFNNLCLWTLPSRILEGKMDGCVAATADLLVVIRLRVIERGDEFYPYSERERFIDAEYGSSVYKSSVSHSSKQSHCANKGSKGKRINAKRLEAAAELAAKLVEIEREAAIEAHRQEAKRLKNQRDVDALEAKVRSYSEESNCKSNGGSKVKGVTDHRRTTNSKESKVQTIGSKESKGDSKVKAVSEHQNTIHTNESQKVQTVCSKGSDVETNDNIKVKVEIEHQQSTHCNESQQVQRVGSEELLAKDMEQSQPNISQEDNQCPQLLDDHISQNSKSCLVKPLTFEPCLSLPDKKLNSVENVEAVTKTVKEAQEMCNKDIGYDKSPPDEQKPWWERQTQDVDDHERNCTSSCLKSKDLGEVTKKDLYQPSEESSQGYDQYRYIKYAGKGKVHSGLVMGKVRMAPTKVASISRQELTATVVLLKLSSMYREVLEIEMNEEYFWTDPHVALSTINDEETRSHLYVANRVEKIKESIDPEKWSRWKREYLAHITVKQRWYKPTRNMKIGVEVMAKDKDPERKLTQEMKGAGSNHLPAQSLSEQRLMREIKSYNGRLWNDPFRSWYFSLKEAKICLSDSVQTTDVNSFDQLINYI